MYMYILWLWIVYYWWNRMQEWKCVHLIYLQQNVLRNNYFTLLCTMWCKNLGRSLSYIFFFIATICIVRKPTILIYTQFYWPHKLFLVNNNNNNNNGIYIALIYHCSKRFTMKKGHKNIINHKLSYNATVHIGKFIA